METPEHITHAAVKRGDNVIVLGRDHSECLGRTPYDFVRTAKQGFWTNLDRYVNREDAWMIAWTAGQLQEYHRPGGLISEMIWQEGPYDYDALSGYVKKEQKR
jgi:hypothetical protein